MKIYSCHPQEFIDNVKLPVRVIDSEADIYEEIAQLMIDTIISNGSESTVIICPVGPIGQYPIFVEKVNKQRISLRNVWFINMDEYLDDNDEFIAIDSPLSFRVAMERLVYSRVDSDLLMPKEQRIFPTPGKENELDALIDKLGKVDCCLTGVGINGHLAFNEPPTADTQITDEEFRNIGTRCLDISKETIVNNGSRKISGALDLFPKRCVTIGMKQILKAKILKVYLYCDWQWGIMRKMALETPSRFTPASFLQSHSNSEMVITRELYHHML